MTVVALGRPDLMDIPAMLELTAARIRRGEFTPSAATLVFLDKANLIDVFGFGEMPDGRACGMLRMAADATLNIK